MKFIDRDDICQLVSGLSHRGPDSTGVHSSGNGSIWFGHARLAIQDLSPAGHQPMVDAKTGNVLVFNGEVYNKSYLKSIVQNITNSTWKGESDTEVLLNFLSVERFENVINKIRGMFSIAYLNVSEGAIYIARDFAGEKPLYYGKSENIHLISSELSTLRDCKKFSFEIEPSAINTYLQYNFIPDPLTIFKGIRKLTPGCYAKLCLQEGAWSSPVAYAAENVDSPATEDLYSHLNTQKSYQSTFNDLLDKVVASQLISDAPIGCFLSGGYDSSLVAAIAQKHSKGSLKTFSLGFDNDDFNEAPYALAVAKTLKTDHHELMISKKEMFKTIDMLAGVWDEPFGDSSQLPSLFLCDFVSDHVRVALSGDGADEFFGGYGRHNFMHTYGHLLKYLPKITKKSLINFARIFPDQSTIPVVKNIKAGSQINRLINVFSSCSPMDRYVSLLGNRWVSASPCIRDSQVYLSKELRINSLTSTNDLMLADQRVYLPGDILVKMDRASMHYSLETRAPFVDRRMSEFSNSYNSYSEKVGKFKGKDLIRTAAHGFIPEKLMDRPKKGFSIPLVNWLNGDLNDWAADGINSIKTRDIVDKDYINFVSAGMRNGHRDAASAVWSLLMLESWLP